MLNNVKKTHNVKHLCLYLRIINKEIITIKKKNMKTTAILTNELLKEIKSKLDNADWTWSFSRNEGDAERATSYLVTQKFSLSYLKNYFENSCDTSFVEEQMDDGFDMVSSFIKESAPNIAEDRCSKFSWSGKRGSWGWDLETVCFQVNL